MKNPVILALGLLALPQAHAGCTQSGLNRVEPYLENLEATQYLDVINRSAGRWSLNPVGKRAKPMVDQRTGAPAPDRAFTLEPGKEVRLAFRKEDMGGACEAYFLLVGPGEEASLAILAVTWAPGDDDVELKLVDHALRDLKDAKDLTCDNSQKEVVFQ